MSQTDYVVEYSGCPIIWLSDLQTKITLSTIESEYVALLQFMQEVLPLMTFLSELKSLLSLLVLMPSIHCTISEDNQGCVDLVECPKMQPRTNHIVLKYDHFRSHVNKTVSIKKINGLLQAADIFTKPLDLMFFVHHQKRIMG